MAELNGGCLCGAVRYTTNATPEFVGLCHCTDCQKHTGSAFAIMVRLPKTALHHPLDRIHYNFLSQAYIVIVI
jgi:hypothetical protein